jgi:SOS-response transcriptional repressor LexA
MSTSETIEISGLPPGTKESLKEIGKRNGQSAEDYLRVLIETEILSQKTFSEILAPIRKDFRESGMTEDELDSLIQNGREALWEEKKAKNEGP